MGVWYVLEERVGEGDILFGCLRNLVTHIRPPDNPTEAVVSLSQCFLDVSDTYPAPEKLDRGRVQ